MSFRVLLFMATPFLLLLACNRSDEPVVVPKYDEEAVKQFAAFLEEGMPARPKKQMQDEFKRCFPKGLNALEVAELLNKAPQIATIEPELRGPLKGADTRYEWIWENGGADSAAIQVYVGYNSEGIRVILFAGIMYLPS